MKHALFLLKLTHFYYRPQNHGLEYKEQNKSPLKQKYFILQLGISI